MNSSVHDRWLTNAYYDNHVPVIKIPHPEIPFEDYGPVREQVVAETWHEGPR